MANKEYSRTVRYDTRNCNVNILIRVLLGFLRWLRRGGSPKVGLEETVRSGDVMPQLHRSKVFPSSSVPHSLQNGCSRKGPYMPS